MKTAMITLYDENYADIAAVCMPNFEAYARKYDIDIIVHRESLDKTRHIYWSKIMAIYKALQDYERVFWNDIDSLFTNFDVNFVEKHDNSATHLGIMNMLDRKPKDGLECQYSVSQMIFYQKPETLEFLRHAYSQTQYMGHIWPEQMALVQAMFDIENSIECKPIAKIFDPIDYMKGLVNLEPLNQFDIVTVGGGPGAKPAKIASLGLVRQGLSVVE